MKSLIKIFYLNTIILFLFGCGPSKEELEIREKQKQDSVLKASEQYIETTQSMDSETAPTDSVDKKNFSWFQFIARNYSDRYFVDVYVLANKDTVYVFVENRQGGISALKLNKDK